MEAAKKSNTTPEAREEFILKLRTDFFKDFLDERYLREYLAKHYNVRDLSNVKVEFMKKDFKELMSTPPDAAIYETLVTRLKGSDNPEEDEKELIFHDEIEKIVMQYLF
jgi:methyltransferase-like protein